MFISQGSEIARATVIIHEGIHAKLAPEGFREQLDHNIFASSYRVVVLDALTEYYKENLNSEYSDEDIETLSWLGLHESNAFNLNIFEQATKNGTSMEEETKVHAQKLEGIIHRAPSKEEKKKEEKEE